MKKPLIFLVLALFVSAISGCVFSASTSSTTNTSNSPGPGSAAKETGKTPSPTASAEPSKSATPEKPKESASKPAGEYENRCGWFVNPTPGNAWLVDADGEWIIGTQGGEQADGDWPEFSDSQWVATNGNYGHGCACMQVTVDKDDFRILKIKSAKAKPLADCRRDKALTEPGDE